MKHPLYAFVALIFLLNGTADALTVRCKTDCNEACPSRWIKLGKFLKTKYRDPTCKAQCEAAKPLACITDSPIPTFPPIFETIQKKLETDCAAAFDLVIGYTKFAGPIGSTNAEAARFNGAKKLLADANLVSAADSHNVIVNYTQWVKPNIAVTPDRNKVYFSETFRVSTDYQLAAVLAHEMKHVEQYRRLGTLPFKCNYVKHWLACGCKREQLVKGEFTCGCQDNRHELEREAYEFENRVSHALATFIAPGSPAFEPPGPRVPQKPGGAPRPSTVLGAWTLAQASPTCKKPKVLHPYFRQDRYDVIYAVNECGEETEIVITKEGSLEAVKWGAAGEVDSESGRYITWRSRQSDDTWSWTRVNLHKGSALIAGSVGDGGENNAADTALVQILLNKWLRRAQMQLLAIDGRVGPNTLAAITGYQESLGGKVDGRVDPNGPTIKALVELQLAS